MSSKPWSGAPNPKSDQWNGFQRERQMIANRISELNMNNLVMIAGDSHMIAVDDGSNTDYSTNGGNGAGFPLFHSAPMAQYGSSKGMLKKSFQFFYIYSCMQRNKF